VQAQRLWIFPPGHSHGWVGEAKGSAQVAVFHFLTAPALLTQFLNPQGFIEIELNLRQVRQIKALVGQVEPYWNRPAPGMMICYEHALMELSLIACEACAAQALPIQESYAQSRVNAAIRWYAERMETNPGFPQVARAVGVSAAHLRRLFHEVLLASPSQIIDQLRFQRATQLMSDPEMKLESIGQQCGFGSASVFSRAFKTKFGASPQAWRSATVHKK
jgi:AraC-like DNA-binding protein